MWEPAISGMGNAHNCASKLQAYPPIFSLTPKASGSTRLQSWEVHKGLLHNQYQKKSEYELDEKGKVSFFNQEVIAVSTSLQKLAPKTDVAIELGGEDAKIIYFENGNVE